MDKTHTFQMRLTEYELAKLRDLADDARCSMAEWLRVQIFGGQPAPNRSAPASEPTLDPNFNFGA